MLKCCKTKLKYAKGIFMKKTFYLMRHGQTLFNLRRKIQGASDSPLTELGIAQAKEAGEYLEDIDFDHYYSSTSERASETLEFAVGNDVPYTRVKGLKEMNFGIFEGESEDLNPQWENGYDEVFPKYGGEFRHEVKDRMKKVCTEIMEKEDHHTVLAASHSGASFHFMRNWVDEEGIKQVFADGGFTNCCIAKYTYEDGVFEFVEMIRPDLSFLNELGL